MNRRLVATLILLSAPVWGQTVDQLRARLDAASLTFKSAKADMRRTSYVASIHQDVVEDGSIVVRRSGPGKVEFLINVTGDNASAWSFRGQTAEHYLPGLNEVQIWDIKKYRDLAQQLMVLGFGVSGKDLAASYTISNPRHETVAGRATTAVDLAPKSADLVEKLKLKKVEIWIADNDASPVKQKLYFSDGNTWLVEYSNVQMNPKLPANSLDLPKAAKRTKMN